MELKGKENLEKFREIWHRYGRFFLWVIGCCIVIYVVWLGWHSWQSKKNLEAARLFDAIEVAIEQKQMQRVYSAFERLQGNYAYNIYAWQAGLMVAKQYQDSGDKESTKETLKWVAMHAKDVAYKAIARLRLAGLLLDENDYEQALTQLEKESDFVAGFIALADDRRGDIFAAQQQFDQAIVFWRKAWQAMDINVPYRRYIEFKLNAQGVNVQGSDNAL